MLDGWMNRWMGGCMAQGVDDRWMTNHLLVKEKEEVSLQTNYSSHSALLKSWHGCTVAWLTKFLQFSCSLDALPRKLNLLGHPHLSWVEPCTCCMLANVAEDTLYFES